MVPKSPTVFSSMTPLLMVLAMKTLIAPRRVSTHIVRPFEVWLILDLLQNLTHWFSEHGINHLRYYGPRLPGKIPPRSVIVITVRPEIPPLLGDDLTLSLALLLVLLDSFILINLIHELAYTGNGLPSQRLPQAVIGRQADLESPYGQVVKVTIYFIEHLPISVQVCFQGFLLSHG